MEGIFRKILSQRPNRCHHKRGLKSASHFDFDARGFAKDLDVQTVAQVAWGDVWQLAALMETPKKPLKPPMNQTKDPFDLF